MKQVRTVEEYTTYAGKVNMPKGTVIEVSDAEAEHLLNLGVWELAPDPAPAPAPADHPKTEGGG